MSNLMIAALIATSAPQAYQALAPEYQREREVESIVSHDAFIAQQSDFNDPSAHINPNAEGYLIETDYYTMQVYVVYEPTGRIGPAQYHLEFADPVMK